MSKTACGVENPLKTPSSGVLNAKRLRPAEGGRWKDELADFSIHAHRWLF
jgi:hypothetical protein